MRRKAAPPGSRLQAPVMVVLFLVLLASGCAAGPPGRTPVSPTATLPPLPTPARPRVGGADLAVAYVFDASAAMQAPLGDVTRLAAARRLLAEHLRTQPMDARLGLWAFGHRRHLTERAASCADVEQVASLLPGQGARIADWLETVQAQGLAPLTAALESALIDLRSAPVAQKGLVLISGGADSCGRDPCAAVQALTATGVEMELHVIALGVDPVAVGQLRCIADAAGGKVHQVANEGEMAQALEEVAAALGPAPIPAPTGPVETMPAPQATPSDTSPAPHEPTSEAALTATLLPPTVTLAAPSPARRGVTTPTRPAAPTPAPSASPSATVLPPPPAETSPPQSESTPYVEALQAVNVRAGPGLIYPVIGRVAVGTRLTPLASVINQAEDRLWLLVCCLPDRRLGWVAAELVTKAPLDLPTPATVPPSPTPSPTLRATATPLLQPTAPPPAPPPAPSPEPPGKLPVPTPVP